MNTWTKHKQVNNVYIILCFISLVSWSKNQVIVYTFWHSLKFSRISLFATVKIEIHVLIYKIEAWFLDD